jgi:hypothetical protein
MQSETKHSLTSMTAAAAPSTISAVSAATTTAAVARHLCKLRIDDLLSLLQDRDEIARLLRIYCVLVSCLNA